MYNFPENYSISKIQISLTGTVILCALALLFNLATSYFLDDVLHVPLFMDTIGTVAVVFYAGLVPGLFVAALYNVLRFMLALLAGNPAYPWNMMYALCGLAIAFSTWLFSYRNREMGHTRTITVLFLILIALVSAFASSLIGASIETSQRLIFGNQIPPSPIQNFVMVFLDGNIGLFFACFVTRIPVTVLDRIICTFAGWGLYLILKKITFHAKMNYE